MKPFLLLPALLLAAPLIPAATFSILPIGDDCPVGPYAMYTGYAEGFVCGFGGVSYTQAGNLVTVTSGLLAPDPWQDTTGTWTFDLSHLYTGVDFAEAFDVEPITYQMNAIPPYSYDTIPIHATLFVAGVPLDDPPAAAAPEPVSVALLAAPVLLLIRFRKRFIASATSYHGTANQPRQAEHQGFRCAAPPANQRGTSRADTGRTARALSNL